MFTRRSLSISHLLTRNRVSCGLAEGKTSGTSPFWARLPTLRPRHGEGVGGSWELGMGRNSPSASAHPVLAKCLQARQGLAVSHAVGRDLAGDDVVDVAHG